MSDSARTAPFAASSWVSARPMPDPAPVTTATRPAKALDPVLTRQATEHRCFRGRLLRSSCCSVTDVAGDQLDQLVEEARRKVVTHAGDDDVAGAGDGVG